MADVVPTVIDSLSDLFSMDKRAPSDVSLSSTVTVADYRAFKRAKDKESIAEFVYQRFYERYLKPFESKDHKHGFAMMACGCLMVEALQSFWTGSAKSGLSGPAFSHFFDRVERFACLREYSRHFYKHVRCGIMHQGETTGGWRIRRDASQLFNSEHLVVDATRFLSALEESLRDYCDLLKASEWGSEVWGRLMLKMNFVCAGTLVSLEYLDLPALPQ